MGQRRVPVGYDPGPERLPGPSKGRPAARDGAGFGQMGVEEAAERGLGPGVRPPCPGS